MRSIQLVESERWVQAAKSLSLLSIFLMEGSWQISDTDTYSVLFEPFSGTNSWFSKLASADILCKQHTTQPKIVIINGVNGHRESNNKWKTYISAAPALNVNVTIYLRMRMPKNVWMHACMLVCMSAYPCVYVCMLCAHP